MKKKINRTRLGVLVLGIICLTVIISDLLVIIISTLLGKTAGWTVFGFISFGGAVVTLDLCIDYLEETTKSKKKRTK